MKRKPKADLWALALILALVLVASQGAAWFSSRTQAEQMRRWAAPGDIAMLSSTTCIYCEKARAWMTRAGVPFHECFIEQDAACRAEFEARGARGTPTLIVRGQTLVGFDRPRVIEILSLR
ncbi:glutaredoxin family protein [Roseateles koreensis]|uniref:Glutaredoxin family protein n=1 Tax=Roseateles koreensis TaxID=2987526 RepID=A0ABT5KTI9_9BURK|nr:glutaredoxin family protein [Roseateles koreensis]MDC8786251.1 glutaredoxin family protein [Roseateles koreensis]